MNIKIIKIMGFFGIITPFVALLMIWFSILLTPGWSITGNTLSDLGGAGFERFGSVVFNSGLFMAGSLMMLFSTGLFELSGKRVMGQLGSSLYLGEAVIIIAIGVATENVEPLHLYLSVALFVLIPLSLIANSVNLYMIGLKIYSAIGVFCFLLSAGIWGIPGPVNGLKETIALIGLVLWQMPLGIWMMRQVEDAED